MLFISRIVRVNGQKYGVVDTDDGVEELVSLVSIKDAIRNGVDIAGVYRGEVDCSIDYIEVWKGLRNSVKQTKLYTVYGIDIRTWDGIICHINWDRDKLRHPVSVRLSDYGVRCGDGIFVAYMADYYTSNPITFVFDDKISISPYTLDDFSMSYAKDCPVGSLVLDISEVMNKSFVETFYQSLGNFLRLSRNESYVVVKDRPIRWMQWRKKLRVP